MATEEGTPHPTTTTTTTDESTQPAFSRSRLPADASQWTLENVGDWIVAIIPEKPAYKDFFIDNEITGTLLPRLLEGNYLAALGVTPIGHQIRIKDAITAVFPQPALPQQEQLLRPCTGTIQGPSPSARKFLNMDRAQLAPEFVLETSAHASDLTWQTSQPVTEANYHVPLKDLFLEKCVTFARQGGLHLIHGHFRSSKTSHLIAVCRRLALLQHFVPLRILLPENIKRMNETEFWSYISGQLQSSASWSSPFSNQQGFIEAIQHIYEQKRDAKVVFLADEFQTLIYCDDAIREAFLGAVRTLANTIISPSAGEFLLHAMLGFGTYNILQLAKQSERGNRLVSPFNINQVVAIPVPTRKVCMKPLREYARCAMSRKVQIDESIFDDILSRTRRHLGLLSRCGWELSVLEKPGISQITLVDWLERAVNLPTQLLNYGEYYTPLNQLSQNEELRSFTIGLLQRDDPFVLQSNELSEKRQQLDQLIDLGLLEQPGADNSVGWTAPIIRDLVLQHLYPKKALVCPSSAIVMGERLDMEALLEQALLLLDQEILFSTYVRKVSQCPSEYVFQAELYSALRELVGSTTYKVLPEAKDRKKLGSRRRIDLLLVNSTKIVIEIKVNRRTKKSLNKAAIQARTYGQALKAQQTILLNFVPSNASLPQDSESLFPYPRAVTTFHVLFTDAFGDLTMLLAPTEGGHGPQRKIVCVQQLM